MFHIYYLFIIYESFNNYIFNFLKKIKICNINKNIRIFELEKYM